MFIAVKLIFLHSNRFKRPRLASFFLSLSKCTLFGMLLFYTSHSSAQFGQTPKQIESKYGSPIKTRAITSSIFIAEYKLNNLRITVQFQDGQSQGVTYLPVKSNDVPSFLKLYFSGNTWIPLSDNNSVPQREWGLYVKGKRSAHASYIHSELLIQSAGIELALDQYYKANLQKLINDGTDF